MKIGRKALEDFQRELARDLAARLAKAFGQPVGFTLFLFDFGARGNLSYISNADRADMINVVREWLARQDAGLTTDPPGDRTEG